MGVLLSSLVKSEAERHTKINYIVLKNIDLLPVSTLVTIMNATDCVHESDHDNDHDGAQDHTVVEGAIGQTANGIEEQQQTTTNRGQFVALARERGELQQINRSYKSTYKIFLSFLDNVKGEDEELQRPYINRPTLIDTLQIMSSRKRQMCCQKQPGVICWHYSTTQIMTRMRLKREVHLTFM